MDLFSFYFDIAEHGIDFLEVFVWEDSYVLLGFIIEVSDRLYRMLTVEAMDSLICANLTQIFFALYAKVLIFFIMLFAKVKCIDLIDFLQSMTLH